MSVLRCVGADAADGEAGEPAQPLARLPPPLLEQGGGRRFSPSLEAAQRSSAHAPLRRI